MENKSYNLRHVCCDMTDFREKRHKFVFEYRKNTHIVIYYGNEKYDFQKAMLPDAVKTAIKQLIQEKIKTEQHTWKYPRAAYWKPAATIITRKEPPCQKKKQQQPL